MIDMRGLRVKQITTPTEVICTSAAGFTRWTCGQYMKFACSYTSGRTNEAWDEIETKLIKLCILQWHVLMLLGPVYMGPDKSLHGQKLAQLHFAFIWDRWNWTNFWTVKCASLGPEKSRSTFWLARFLICTDSCKHLNCTTFCSDRAVMAWNQIHRLV